MPGPEDIKEDKTSPLSPEWQEVVKSHNISQQFAENLRDSARKNGNVIGMRLDERFHQGVERPFACKPAIVKLKTGNWGWMQEVIPVDQTFLSKSYHGHVKPGDHTPQTKDPEKHPDSIQVMTRMISLQEIMEGMKRGEFERVEDATQKNRLIVKPIPGKGGAPDDTQVLFSITLPDEKQSQKMSDSGSKPLITPASPAWWKSDWGDFQTALQSEYPAQYKTEKDAEFHNIEIFGVKVDGKAYPFGKDNDGFLPTVSKEEFSKLPAIAKEVINTFVPGGAEKMLVAMQALHEHVWLEEAKKSGKEMTAVPLEKKAEIIMQVAQYNTAKFGAGTAYDFYVANDLNRGVKEEAFKYLQHGFEAYNPMPKEKQSNIDAPMLWIDPTGQPHVKLTEKEHVEFLKPHCGSQVFHVNPYYSMDMSMWGGIVLKQLEAKLPVSPPALASFLEVNKNVDDAVLKHCVELSKNAGGQGDKVRTELYSHFTDMFEKKAEPISREMLSVYNELKLSDPKGKGNPEIVKTDDAYKSYVNRHVTTTAEESPALDSKIRPR